MATKNEKIRRMRDDIRSAYKSTETEEYFDRIFTKPLGYLWARLFMKLGWSPNMVTILSMILGFAGGWMFYPTNIWWNLAGVLLVIWADILDSTDGQMARLTGKSSELGRILDGLSTSAWFIAIYAALCFRLMPAEIPFAGGATWGAWIWLVAAVSAFGGHELQCLMADYYRTIHISFLRGREGGELVGSDVVKAKLNAMTFQKNGFIKLFYCGYYTYTRLQERLSPAFQRMLAGIDKKYGGEMPPALREEYLKQSRRYVQLTNVLTFNTRAYTLFACLLLGVPVWYFPIEIFLFGALLVFMLLRYDGICRALIKQYELE